MDTQARSTLGARAVASLFAVVSSCATGAELEVPMEASLLRKVETAPLPDLEYAFWRCDYMATVSGVDATPVHLCVAVTEQLKRRKFENDFERMLHWWRLNKLAEHGKIAPGR